MTMDNNDPLITIGIACYNAGDTVSRAIKSALAQDWSNLDVVIVDDASADDTAAIAEKLIAGHAHARLIRHAKNAGPGGVRQTIINNARGDFVAFFDDDDESAPQRVRKQYDRITAYEKETGVNLIACYASGIRIYPNGYKVPLSAIGSQPGVPHGPAVVDYLLLNERHGNIFYGSGTPSCSLMARTETFKSSGGFDPALRRAEDIDFAVRLAMKGGHFIGCAEPLFTQYATNAADKAPEKNLSGELSIAEKHKDYLQSIHRYDYATIWPTIRYYHFKRQHGKMAFALGRLFIKHPLKTSCHFLRSAPRRLIHEIKMKKSPQ